MRGDVQDARGNASPVDRLDRFRESGAITWSGRKLRQGWSRQKRTDPGAN
jgi:hypothetical protein